MVYELAIELGLRSSPDADQRLRAAVRAALTYPGWEGQATSAESDAVAQMTETHAGHARGVAFLPDGRRVAGNLMVIREEGDGASDWLAICLRVEALAEAYPGPRAYPFGTGGVPARAGWQETVDEWLLDVGQRIFASAPFLLGLIGCEQSGSEYAADLDAAGGPPEERWGGYLWREGSELRWYPPTLYGPPSTPDPRGHPT